LIERRLMNMKLPIAGIIAFSLCSVTSIYYLLAGHARHPSPVLWLPAVLVELVTAWAVWQIVEQARLVSRSKRNQDRRFHSGILAAFVVVALPLLTLSVWANTTEFQNLLLGFMFPVASIGCAIGAALPETVETYAKRNQALAQTQANERKRKQKEKECKSEESARRARERQAQLEESKGQAERQLVASLGKAGETLQEYLANPTQSQASVAQALGITRQAVGQHLSKLEKAGVIKRNGQGIEAVIK